MHTDFWHQRWQQQQIGFHQSEVNPYLLQYWQTLNIPVGSTVLVPLCGKSSDMLWLLAQGYRVIGVELSPLAVEAFFQEHNLSAQTRQQGVFQVSYVDGLSIYCGDFFALTAADLAKVAAVFDRAALVALPSDMRVAYAGQLQQLLAAGTPMLLVCFEYDQPQMSGPPFSVSQAEVERLYPNASLQILHVEDILQQQPQFLARGLNALHERVYRLNF
jgi:thiopurine S-methyltransferase